MCTVYQFAYQAVGRPCHRCLRCIASFHTQSGVAASSNGVEHINEVVLRRTRLVLRWVTFHGYTVFVYYQSLRPT